MYEPKMTRGLKYYSVFRFLIVALMGLSVKFIATDQGMAGPIPGVVFVLLLASLVMLGWVVESRVVWLEYVRLLIVAFAYYLIVPLLMFWVILAVCIISDVFFFFETVSI